MVNARLAITVLLPKKINSRDISMHATRSSLLSGKSDLTVMCLFCTLGRYVSYVNWHPIAKLFIYYAKTFSHQIKTIREANQQNVSATFIFFLLHTLHQLSL